MTSETGWADGKVIDTYRGLWQIDELFSLIGEPAPVRYMRTGDIKALLAKKNLKPIG